MEHILQDISISQEQDAIVSIEDNIYYKQVLITIAAETMIYKIGESFSITFNDYEETCKINYKPSAQARILARDLEFMLSWIEYGYFKIDENTFFFNREELDFSNFDIERERENLKFAKKVVDVLDLVDCQVQCNSCCRKT